MINALEIKGILDTYKKFGWKLEKVLLTNELQTSFSDGDFVSLFGNIKVHQSKIDGLWFSRQSKKNKIAWELRHIHSSPFALVELIDENLSNPEKEEILRKAETRLENHASNKLSNKDH